MARGDDDSPYTVRMQPWGSVTGRIVDKSGKPHVRTILTAGSSGTLINPDATIGDSVGTKTDADGRFRIDRLVPGLSYTVRAYPRRGHLLGTAFEKLVVEPGKVRNLGGGNPLACRRRPQPAPGGFVDEWFAGPRGTALAGGIAALPGRRAPGMAFGVEQ